MDLSKIPDDSIVGRLLRAPLKALPHDAVVPILSGRLRGKKWIVGSSLHACWLGVFESKKQAIFSELVSPGGVVLDLGGNVGFYTLLASELVGEGGRVMVFEPLPRNLHYLRAHLELNHVGNVEVFDVAVSATTGVAMFEVCARAEMGHLSATGQLAVKTVRLDDLFSLGRIPAPQVMKLDVEGAEFDALNGAKNLLTTTHPSLLLATHDRQIHQNCCDLLLELHYSLFPLDADTLTASSELLAVASHSNGICSSRNTSL